MYESIDVRYLSLLFCIAFSRAHPNVNAGDVVSNSNSRNPGIEEKMNISLVHGSSVTEGTVSLHEFADSPVEGTVTDSEVTEDPWKLIANR